MEDVLSIVGVAVSTIAAILSVTGSIIAYRASQNSKVVLKSKGRVLNSTISEENSSSKSRKPDNDVEEGGVK